MPYIHLALPLLGNPKEFPVVACFQVQNLFPPVEVFDHKDPPLPRLGALQTPPLSGGSELQGHTGDSLPVVLPDSYKDNAFPHSLCLPTKTGGALAVQPVFIPPTLKQRAHKIPSPLGTWQRPAGNELRHSAEL